MLLVFLIQAQCAGCSGSLVQQTKLCTQACKLLLGTGHQCNSFAPPAPTLRPPLPAPAVAAGNSLFVPLALEARPASSQR